MGCATGHSVVNLDSGISVHTFRREFSNVHVVTNGASSFMVDAGLERNAQALSEDMRQAGIDPKQLRAIILTHGHADHAGGAFYFRQQFGTRIVAGTGDVARFTTGKNEQHVCPTDFIARQRMKSDLAETYTPFDADIMIDQPYSLQELTGISATVTPLPGHTPGSVVIRLPQAAFVGDLFRGSFIGNSAETHFYMCDLEDNREDVRSLLNAHAPDAKWIFPGHFGPVTPDAVRKHFLN